MIGIRVRWALGAPVQRIQMYLVFMYGDTVRPRLGNHIPAAVAATVNDHCCSRRAGASDEGSHLRVAQHAGIAVPRLTLLVPCFPFWTGYLERIARDVVRGGPCFT